jgi:RNA polymerase sigma-70 factor, ECF subfamily
MKDGRGSRDSGTVQLVASPLMASGLAERSGSVPGVEDVYAQHADFVWRTLQHLGVRSADLEDLGQEVFVTVHRKLSSFDGRSKLTTWLFGICLNLVMRHRRRAYLRLEFLHASPPERVDPSTPEDRFAEEEARLQLQQLLAKLSPERRATFVLFEIEGMSCEEIAELTSVPVGTVYSRLHLARKQVQAAAARLRRTGTWRDEA